MSAAVVEAEGLVRRYGDRTVVDGVSFSIAAGEIFGLVGPNGAGKTTTVEILAGLRVRSDGRARVLGKDPGRAGRAWRARLGIVHQQAGDHADWKVSELVGFVARHFPRAYGVDEVLARVGAGDLGEQLVRTLSGGQRRRIDVALGIVGRPEVLFLDEPTTGFDPEIRRQFWALVRGIADDGTAILLTTHHLDEVEALADRLGVMADGRLVTVAAPADLGGDREVEVRWLEAGVHRSVRTADPGRLVGELCGVFGGEVPGLEVRRTSLEDRYLDLIGHGGTP